MLYHLLYSLSDRYPWLDIIDSRTLRSMLAFLVSIAVVLFVQPIFIRWLQERGVKGQPIREDGPKGHAVKSGTPTMGGMVIVGAVALSTLLFCDLTNLKVWVAFSVMIGFAWLGFVDDWRKITKQNSKGLSEREKLIVQVVIGAVAASVLVYSGFSTRVTIPFLKGVGFELWGPVFVLFVAIVITGTSNAVNFTDGLDGLAIGPIMTVAATYAVFAYIAGHANLARDVQLMPEAGAADLTILLSAVVAAGLGFLWYNTFPAQVFMGDTGSMAMGGLLSAVAVMVKQELILVLAGGIFVAEAMSVIIQRYCYKLTKKRVFRMAPIHHHFELLGWAEPKIIVRFWIISIVLAVLSLSSLKLV